jgi:hypothetical protein
MSRLHGNGRSVYAFFASHLMLSGHREPLKTSGVWNNLTFVSTHANLGRMSTLPEKQSIRAVLSDAAVGFPLVVGTAIALVTASLAAAGVITVALAYLLLAFAWLVTISGSFLVRLQLALKHPILFIGIATIGFGLIGTYEGIQFEKPATEKGVAQEVVKALKPILTGKAGEKDAVPRESPSQPERPTISVSRGPEPIYIWTITTALAALGIFSILLPIFLPRKGPIKFVADMHPKDLVRYLHNEARWSEQFSDRMAWALEMISAIRDQLYKGNVHCEGRKPGRWGDGHWRYPTGPIEREFWGDGDLNWRRIINEGYDGPIDASNRIANTAIDDIRFCRAEVEKVWPPRNRLRRWLRPTPFEPFERPSYGAEKAQFEAAQSSISKRNALQIILGTEGEFETRKASGLYKTTHTFNVSLKNENCERFISNCKFYLSIADKDNGNKRDYALNVEPFTLNPTEERFFSIVSYEEPASVSGHAGEFIRLLIPVTGAYYGVGSGWPWQLPVGSYVFALFATSKEHGRVEVVCKIWVDHDKKLHFTRA